MQLLSYEFAKNNFKKRIQIFEKKIRTFFFRLNKIVKIIKIVLVLDSKIKL